MAANSRMRAYLQRNEFLRHVLTLMSGTVIAQALPILSALVLGQKFSDTQMGLYTAVMSVAAFVIPLAAWRYDLAIVLPDEDADARQLVRLATFTNTVSSIVMMVLMLIFGGRIARLIHQPGAAHLLLWVGPIMWSWAEFTILQYWANRRKNFKLVRNNQVINSVVTNVGQVGAGFGGWGVIGLLLSTIVGEFVAVGHGLRTVYRQVMVGPEPGARGYRQLMAEYKKMPLLNLPNAMVDQVRLQGINLMLAAYLSIADLGQFGMAWRLVQAPMAVINGALNQVFLQRLSRGRRGEMSRLVRQSMKRSALIGIAPFALIYFLAPPLLPLLLNPGNHAKWQPAGQVTAMLVPWLFMNFITQPISTVFIVVRRQGTLLMFAIVYAALPLSVIWWRHGQLISTVRWVSWGMTVLLLFFMGLTLWVAHQFDHGTPRPDEVVAGNPAAVDPETDDPETGDPSPRGVPVTILDGQTREDLQVLDVENEVGVGDVPPPGPQSERNPS